MKRLQSLSRKLCTNPSKHPRQVFIAFTRSYQSQVATKVAPELMGDTPLLRTQRSIPLQISESQNERQKYPSPPKEEALQSAKLSSLHARLTLPIVFNLHTLARCLVDLTADDNQYFNNSSLAILGSDITAFHVSEYLMCKYPRLPQEVLFAAQKAYLGPESLSSLAKEWGVEMVVSPGGEVDPGYLQFRRLLRSEPTYVGTEEERRIERERASLDPDVIAEQAEELRPSRSTRVMRWNIFGEDPTEFQNIKNSNGEPVTTPELASSNFVNAVVGGLAMHAGKSAAKSFVYQHILSRKLDISTLFSYNYPMKDVTVLCRREGFEEPIGRIISETGRGSAHPIFVIGIFSGRNKLGEGVGGSIFEARTRAAVASLKGWYLYSPLEFTVPSDLDKSHDRDNWVPNMIDPGEVYR